MIGLKTARIIKAIHDEQQFPNPTHNKELNAGAKALNAGAKALNAGASTLIQCGKCSQIPW